MVPPEGVFLDHPIKCCHLQSLSITFPYFLQSTSRKLPCYLCTYLLVHYFSPSQSKDVFDLLTGSLVPRAVPGILRDLSKYLLAA